ncbi:hypothetical protein NBRC116592_09940 [Colwellia sp. KU-HH00111]
MNNHCKSYICLIKPNVLYQKKVNTNELWLEFFIIYSLIKGSILREGILKLIGLFFLAILSGCVSSPQIAKNETSASIFVTSSDLETNSIYPDETIFVRVFTPEQSVFYDAPLSVIILNPKKAGGNFFLNSEVTYKIMLNSSNSGPFSSSSCSTLLAVTPSKNGVYKIQFNVNEPNNKCSLILSDHNSELINKSFVKNKTYYIPIPIPIPF